jgi:hypothetical protein
MGPPSYMRSVVDRNIVMHYGTLQHLQDTWQHDLTEHARFLLFPEFWTLHYRLKCRYFSLLFITDALWYICNYRWLLRNERIRSVQLRFDLNECGRFTTVLVSCDAINCSIISPRTLCAVDPVFNSVMKYTVVFQVICKTVRSSIDAHLKRKVSDLLLVQTL